MQDLLVQLIVLVVDFALHSSVVEFNTSEDLVVFTGVEGFAAVSNLVEELIPLFNVVAEESKDVVLVDVPQCLVGLPRVVVSFNLAENALKNFVGFLN
jgi:hypothetical protein